MTLPWKDGKEEVDKVAKGRAAWKDIYSFLPTPRSGLSELGAGSCKMGENGGGRTGEPVACISQPSRAPQSIRQESK